MEGIPLPDPEDGSTHPRIKVLTYDDAPELGRRYNQWDLASPPLHSKGTGVGPGDYFARTLIAALPSEVTVGLVPCAIKGVDIDFFRKGVLSARRAEFPIPPDNHWTGAYEWVIERARVAQRSGVVRGILFHQGESDCCRQEWLGKVAEVVSDLRNDLVLGPSTPFLVGELLHGGNCSAHNELVGALPGLIENTHVVSAANLAGMDPYHFDLPGQRELGRRYGATMLRALAASRDAS